MTERQKSRQNYILVTSTAALQFNHSVINISTFNAIQHNSKQQPNRDKLKKNAMTV